MIEKAYKIIDKIDASAFKKRLFEIKKRIGDNNDIKSLINDFEKAKENYGKYGLKEEFIEAKRNLLKNELISEYVKLQNDINMLTLNINNRIKMITEGVTSK